MKYKVCVYAICKNEEKFVQRWAESMSEADYVVVLDTGSEDNTVALLQSLGVYVEQKIISPWRFDIARNESMKLIPEDSDICVCTDLDEAFEAGWRNKLEAAWDDDTCRLGFRYTWNFNEDGSEGYVFNMSKTHKRTDYIWRHPVHEVITYTGTDPEKYVFAEGVQLNHYADNTKPRSSYLPLLELSVKEDPFDDRNVHYLGREYMYYGMWDKAIETLKRHLILPRAKWKDERCASMRYIAKCYEEKNDKAEAKCWLYRAIAEAPYTREPYMDMTRLMYSEEDWDGVLYMAKSALAITEKTENYITDAKNWGASPYDFLSLAYYYTERYSLALEAVKAAADLAPEDERIQKNLEIISHEVNLHNN